MSPCTRAKLHCIVQQRAFEALQHAGLEEQFGLEAQDTTAVIPLSAPSLLDKGDEWLFKREGPTKSHDRLKRICGAKTWETPTPLHIRGHPS